MNCKKCSVDLTGLKKFKTKLGLLCEYCRNKYILGQTNLDCDSWKPIQEN